MLCHSAAGVRREFPLSFTAAFYGAITFLTPIQSLILLQMPHIICKDMPSFKCAFISPQAMMAALGFDQLEERLTAKLAMFVFRANARGPDPAASFPRQVCL